MCPPILPCLARLASSASLKMGGGGLWGGCAFANAVGALAEKEGYYPAIPTERSRVTISWWT